MGDSVHSTVNVLIRQASKQACRNPNGCEIDSIHTKKFCVGCGLPAENPKLDPYGPLYELAVEDNPTSITYEKAHKWLIVAVLAVLVLNVADVAVTMAALDLGATELNPLAKFLIETEIFVPIIWPVKIGVCLWAALMAWYPDKTSLLRRYTVAWWVVGVYTMVVFMNTVNYLMRR